LHVRQEPTARSIMGVTDIIARQHTFTRDTTAS